MPRKLTDDEWTYANIQFMAVTIGELLDQYHTHWMPPALKKHYKKMRKDANKLEIIAGKLLDK